MSAADNNLAFERLVRPHFDRLYRLAWRLAGSKAEAEDLFQDLLLKAYGLLDQLVTIDQPGPWLARVMYNLFVDERRRFHRRRMQTVEEGELPGDGVERNHQGLGNQLIYRDTSTGETTGEVARHERLSEMLHYYHRRAA
jgi:DNA-directed RNA polymerase specialized sigma24 family protein